MKAAPYLKLIRLPNALLSGIGAAFAINVFSGYSAEPLKLLIGFITGFLLTGASMIVNDIVDAEVDKLNKPWKPIPSGEADIGIAQRLAASLVIIALLANALIGWGALAVSAIYAAIGIGYDFARRLWWSHALVAASTTGPIVYGYVVSGSPSDSSSFAALFSLVIFIVTLGREFLKAVQDFEGDSRRGYRTIATAFGVRRALLAMLLTGLAGSALGIATIAVCSGTLYRALIALAAILYAYSIITAYRRGGAYLERARKLSLAAMTIGIVAFWLSGF